MVLYLAVSTFLTILTADYNFNYGTAEAQVMLIPKMAAALKSGGKLLFISPYKAIQWKEAMTGHWSGSLGAEKYKELISSSGLSLIGEFDDEGENHCYHAMKITD